LAELSALQQQREHHLALALEAARMVAWSWDVARDRVETTGNIADIYGVSAVEYAAQGFAMIHPEDVEQHRDIVNQAIATGHPYRSVFRIVRPDNGQTVWIEERAVPVSADDGQLHRLTGIVLDVTDRKRAEQDLLRLNQDLHRRVDELQTLLDIVPIGICVAHDPLGLDMTINPSGAAMLGIAPDVNPSKSAPAAGELPFTILRDGVEVPPEALPIQAAAARNVVLRDLEYDVVHADGRVINLLEYAAPLHDEQGRPRGSVGVFVDISDRKRFEASLRQAHLEAEQSADRLRRLYRVTTALASRLNAPEVARVIVAESMAALDASASAIYLLSDDNQWLRLAAAIGWPEESRRQVEQLPVGGNMPAADVYRSGEALWLESNAALLARYPFLAPLRAPSGNQALAVIPLRGQDSSLGVLSISFLGDREFGPDDRSFLLARAGQCALALERADLDEAERAARRLAEHAASRTGRLQSVTAELAQALSPDAVADTLIDHVVRALGAQAGWLSTLTRERTLSVVRASGFAPGDLERFPPLSLDDAHPAAQVARTGQPVWLRSQAEFASRYPDAGQMRQPNELQASAFVALCFESRVLGVLGVSFALEPTFTPEDQALLLAMAGAGAQAMERARLYAEAYRLNAELEQRVQVRTEELEVTVEELRRANMELEREMVERERADARFRQGEQRLAEAQQVARLGSWYWDVAADALTWSDELYRIYGSDPRAFAGTYESLLERVHPQDQDLVRSTLAQAFQDHQPFAFDYRILRPDGTVRTLHARGEVITAAGRLVAMRGTGQDITERKAMEDELRASRQQLVEEVAARLRAQQQLENWREAERARIAREVHDELGGALTSLKMGLSRLRKTGELSPAAQAQAARLADEIDATTQITRRIATELRPALLDDFGLLAALESQFKEFLNRSGLNGDFQCELAELSLSDEASIAIFRIFQEALTNVARHAQARRVEVSIRLDHGRIVLQIADDGQGLPAGGQAAHGHLGLVGMRERAALLGGELELVSAPGQGTRVILRVPAADSDTPSSL
jgi:two-component system sensor histidine kinase UhpB